MSASSGNFIAAWLAAAEKKDLDQLSRLLTAGATLVSPISFKNLTGRAAIAPIFAAIFDVLPDLKYSRCEGFPGGACLIFTATLPGGIVLEGLDLFTLENEDQASELKVFVRPLKAANLFAAEMQKTLAQNSGKSF